MNKNETLLNDAIDFFQITGGANSLCESGREPDEIMDILYMEDIENLTIKWIANECSITDINKCLEVESLLSKFFKSKILEIMNK